MVIALFPKIYINLFKVINVLKHLIFATKEICYFSNAKELCYVHYKIMKKRRQLRIKYHAK